MINEELLSRNVHIACLQEITLEASYLSSKDYDWHVSKHKSNKSRGKGILIRNCLYIAINKIEDQLENIQLAEITLPIHN